MKPSASPVSAVAVEHVERRILQMRGHKVMLDSDLAELYGVETKALNRAVRRNRDRFPADFMFQLTGEEHNALRFQFGTSKPGRGGRRYLPLAFTEQGVAMLSSVLRSRRAVRVNVEIMRAFIRLRGILAEHKELARRLADVEVKVQNVFDVLRKLQEPPPPPAPEPPKPRIGFHRG